jgi:glycosyltransferase involved in cell wall biosynthesis
MAKEAAIGVVFGMPVSDIVATELYRLTPAFEAALQREAGDATVLVACHPYLYPALSAVANGRPIWYEAQDIESHLKARVLPESPEKAAWLAKIRSVEANCCEAARWVIACSNEDAKTLHDEFAVARERIVLAPNGTDGARIPFTPRAARAANKQRLSAGGAPIALFMGSGHPPNIEAVQQLFSIARELPEVVFAVLGNAAYAFAPGAGPANVWLLGESSDIARQILFEAADVALNPMCSGSGTNLKMLDYFAAGLPVVTTPIGARGLPIDDGKHVFIREIDAFSEAIAALIYQPATADALIGNARALVDDQFNWERIGDRLLATVLSG